MPNIEDIQPQAVKTALAKLENALNEKIPPKRLEQNLLVATWNLRALGDLTRKWKSGPEDSPKRDLESAVAIATILSRFDVIAIQEVKGNLRALRDILKYLGPNWSLILTDVARGGPGNGERLAYIFDNRRIKLSGLACELVVPEETLSEISEFALKKQFARTPYAVGFKAHNTTFVLVTLHILYGNQEKDRIPELRAIAKWMAGWAKQINDYEQNLIAMGDFNIDQRGDLLNKSFISEGLAIAEPLQNTTRSIFNETAFYDQIAWFNGADGIPELTMKCINGGNFDFIDTVLTNRGLTKQQLSFYISDHYPLWVEFTLI